MSTIVTVITVVNSSYGSYLAGQTRVDPAKVGGQAYAKALQVNVGVHIDPTCHWVWNSPHSSACHVG